NLCVHVDYATQPQGTNTGLRLLNLPAAQTVQDCRGVTLATKRFEYDGLTGDQAGQVTNGFVTSSTVTRYDMDSHLPLGGPIRLFDATFDGTGNLSTVTKTRDDGATRTTSISYDRDPFGLVATGVSSSATNPDGTVLPTTSTSITLDPVTMNVLNTTDPNG